MFASSDFPPESPAPQSGGLVRAFGLLLLSLPFALARFGCLAAFAVACLVWLVVTIGGTVWLGTHVAQAFGGLWFIACAVIAGWFWLTLLRYFLHLIDYAHVAVLTELVLYGRIANGSEPMLAYGRRIVLARFGEVNALLVMNLGIRSIVNAFHATLDWLAELLPIPGLEFLANRASQILGATTRNMDRVIFSYTLSRNAQNPWDSARDGLVYYCQNAKSIVLISVLIIVLDYVMSAIVCLILLVPAGLITVLLPHAMREMGAVMTIATAFVFALAVRAAFIKPLLLIMLMLRFHALIAHQAVNAAWVAELERISGTFRDFGARAQDMFAGARPGRVMPS